jgi:hypothetical protein
MGLDVRAFNKIVRTDLSTRDEEDSETYFDDDNYVAFYLNPHFPNAAIGINPDYFYMFEKSIHLNCGSYGTYNRWRNGLAQMVGYPLTEYDTGFNSIASSYAAACWEGATGPFSELINFSDCEGTLDETVCKKLAKDFADYQEKANTFNSNDLFVRTGDRAYWLEKYNKWRELFELASDAGAIRFS